MAEEKKSAPAGAEPIAVVTIPPEFYAGQNPAITFKTTEKVVNLGTELSVADKKILDRTTAPGSGEPLHPVSLLSNRRVVIVGSMILFVLLVAGVSWYYWQQATAPQPVGTPRVDSAPTSTATINEQNSTTTQEQPPVSTTSTVATPVVSEAKIAFPSLLLGDSGDNDKDGLTNPEEELFNTDPEVPDTDNDKYSDSHEVYNLYNPAGKEPMKIIDSGLVKEFTNPVFNYALYYPTNWAVGAVDQNYRDVLFSTITGEYVEVRAFDRSPGTSFNDWFTEWAPEENFADLVTFSSAFKQAGQRRKDYLVYYFTDPSHVYVLLYHTTDTTQANYRSVIKMIARSFRLAAEVAAPLPAEEGVSTTTLGL